MFGGLDRDLIADVLDSHGCQMEPTVDALLILSGAQGNSPREAQASGRPGHLTDTRRSFSSSVRSPSKFFPWIVRALGESLFLVAR